MDKLKAIINFIKTKAPIFWKHFGTWYIGLSTSMRVIITIIMVASLWMSTGIFKFKHSKEEKIVSKPNIKTEIVIAQEHDVKLSYNAVSVPMKNVLIRSESDGEIIEINAKDGQYMEAGQLIAQIDQKFYIDNLEQAITALSKQNILYDSAKALYAKNLSSESSLKDAESNFKQAKANLAKAEDALKNTRVVAPFNGYMDNIQVEVGNYLSAMTGNNIGYFMDLSKIKAVAYIPQKDIALLGYGQKTEARIRNRTVPAEILFISKVALNDTKSFEIEAVFDNPNTIYKAGESIRLIIYAPSVVKLHYVAKSTPTIDIGGNLIIKTINDEKKVKSIKIEIVDEDEGGFWVKNLPETAKIITMGADYITDDQVVD